ncbi:uncharacterized protein DEA37_0006433 [Paragonimus westermani]|uniref:Integrase catalytic domain-containing protein n=1 Tax=Paragonimus westermani TaxID=34504 RepID=A0A5J4N3M3_9TREM|nr:uncharacterized protein DEA37_0006433 [Paragonimus westermani]
MPNQEASTITSLFINGWVAGSATLIELHSDQGAAFESRLIEEVCRMLRIRKTGLSPYHPQSNGLVERTTRTVMTILLAFIERHQSDLWDEILPQCLLAYRAAVHSSTRHTPSLLTLGHELRLPIEVLTPLAPAKCIGLPHYIKELGERLRVAYKIAAQHQSKSQHHQKSCYDRTVNGPVHRVGDHVWVYRPKPPLGAAHKFNRPWLGPVVIVHVRSLTVYVISDTANPTADVLTVHYNQLKPTQTLEEAQMWPLPVPSGSVPIAEQIVEMPVEGDCSNSGGTEALGSAPH